MRATSRARQINSASPIRGADLGQRDLWLRQFWENVLRATQMGASMYPWGIVDLSTTATCTYFENRLRSRTRVQSAAIVDCAIVDFSYETNVVYVNACSEKCHTSKLILRIS